MEITEQLTLLAELSNVEAKIRASEHQLEAIPAEARKAEEFAAGLKGKVTELEIKWAEVDKGRRERELALSTEKDNQRKWTARLDKIREEREYQALNSEIGAAKRAVARLENDVLERMQELEDVEKDRDKARTVYENAKAEAAAEWAKVDDELNAIKADIAKNNGARQALLDKLPKPLVARYERIAEKRQGMGVALIEGEVCKACRRTLPPQLVLQVYKGAIIEQCPSCNRILVHESMTRSAAPDTASDSSGASPA